MQILPNRPRFLSIIISTPYKEVRLEALDRQILETICRHGREGQSFNKLVADVKPIASLGSLALVPFGFLEQMGIAFVISLVLTLS